MGAFLGGTFVEEKGIFLVCTPPKQMPFLTISNENIFLKTQGTRLAAIVATNKGLDWALTSLSFLMYSIFSVCLSTNISQTSRVNNLRTLRIKNAKFSRYYYYYMKTNIWISFQVCICVPLT